MKKAPQDRPDIIALTAELLHEHYERNLDAVLAHLADDAVWIGPFDFQWADSREAFRRVAASEYEAVPARLTQEEYHCALKSSGVFLVYGRFLLTATLRDGRVMQARIRASVFWKRIRGELKVAHLHISDSEAFSSGGEASDSSASLYEYVGRHMEHVPAERDGKHKIPLRDIAGCSHYLYASEIISVQSDAAHCVITLRSGSFRIRERITALQALLPDDFVRIHRGALVNRAYMSELTRYRVTLSDGTALPVSKDRYMSVKKKLR